MKPTLWPASNFAMACVIIGLGVNVARARDAGFSVKMMTPETALKAGIAAIQDSIDF